ncbi:spore germination protein GerW family protein, partial [Bacillus licheniformis]
AESKASDGDRERKESKLPFGGGSGGGVSITPIAFLIVGSSGVKVLHLDENTHVIDKILDSAPQTIERIQHMFKKNDKQKQNMNRQNQTPPF